MSATVANFNDVLTTLREYFGEPDNQVRMQRAVSAGLDTAETAILTDSRWRVPRQLDLRRDGFKKYIAPYREHIVGSMALEMTREFPNVLSRENAQIAAQLAMSQADPELQERYWRVLEQQVRLAVRGIALPWVSDNLGDRCQLFLPLRDDKARVWRIPVSLDALQPPRAYVVVSDDGEILSDSEALLGELSRE